MSDDHKGLCGEYCAVVDGCQARGDEIERLRAELAAERERLDFIETYVKARAEEHEFLAGMAGGVLSGKKQRVRAHEAATILGRIREVRK